MWLQTQELPRNPGSFFVRLISQNGKKNIKNSDFLLIAQMDVSESLFLKIFYFIFCFFQVLNSFESCVVAAPTTCLIKGTRETRTRPHTRFSGFFIFYFYISAFMCVSVWVVGLILDCQMGDLCSFPM